MVLSLEDNPFTNYILDFYCHALQLVIEVDGSVHEQEDVKKNDEQRQKQLEEHGLVVLRFTNELLKLQSEKVIGIIKGDLQQKKSNND